MDTIITNAQSQGRVAGLASTVSNGQPVPQRLEIDDLVKNHAEAFNLYVLALESIQKDKYKEKTPAAMQNMKQGMLQDRMSYFEVAGIHGLPNRPWDNVSSKTMFRREIGYCTHGSKLFPTWHRPYVSMMEQTIFDTMGKIAEQFTDPKYKEAARTFRLPYWDYFQPRMRENGRIDFGLPRVLKEENLMVIRPGAKGSPVSMPNPLKSFTFPGTGGLAEEDWSAKNKGEDVFFDDPSIYSRKHTERYALSKNREKDLDAALENNMSDQLTYMNLILSDVYKDYTHFATGRKTRHMSEVEVAAFDPVFWLHHSNIDRIFAIWQEMNDDFITKTDDPKESDDTSLYPFRLPTKQREKEFWDSKSSKSPATFGYTYPDLEKKADGKSIRRRYEEKDAIDGVFTVFYFVGPLSELNNDPHCCWTTESNLAGLNHIFSARKENCSNCEDQAEAGLVVTSTSPINSTLRRNIKAGRLQSLKPDDVEPFLKKNLFWRVVKANRTTEDPAQVSSLKVSVSATYSVLRPGDIMPQFREGHYFPEITADHRSGNPVGQ
ncbi:putative tyrosinase precursor [Diplodia seriata]|uniref:tyrosinase n=1 Tax=Diplodia seriata TaxID=420778 RepID=A0A0G2E3R6_9PEZI|nr:putative tyrosinase precursor [Diplodia seriata]